MKIKRQSLRGATGIKLGLGLDEIQIDYEQFDEGMIAYVGENGCGKSTTVENLTPFPTMMSKGGSLYDHFYLRDSHRNVVYDIHGHEIEIKLLIDPTARKTEAYIFRDGLPLNDGKMGSYETEVRKLFGSEGLFRRSVFRAQNAENFASVKPADRKALFVELLGIDRIAKYHEVAKQKAAEQERKIAELRAKIQAVTETAGNVEEIDCMIGDQRAGLAIAEAAYNQARDDEATARAALTEARTAQQRVENARISAQEARQRENEAQAAYQAAAKSETTENDRHATRDAELAARRDKAQKYILGRQRITDALENLDRLRDQSAEMDELARAVGEARAAFADAEREYRLLMAGLDADVAMKRAAHEKAMQELTAAQSAAALAGRNQLARIAEYEKRAALLDTVPCAGLDINETCPLLMSARVDRDAIETMRGVLADIEHATFDAEDQAVVDAADAWNDAREAQGETDAQWRIKLPEIQARIDALPYDPVAHREITDEIAAETAKDWPGHKATADAAEQQIRDIDADIEAERRHHAQQLENIGAHRVATLAALNRATGDSERLEAEYQALETADVFTAERAASAAARFAEDKRLDWQNVQTNITALETRLAAAREAWERVATLQADEARESRQYERLAYLVKATGKNGIQAMELDASGPNISAIANQLLAETFGSEFQIGFDTTALSADGKKQIDTFEITVYRDGEENKLEYLSIGQQVWVDSAIMQAIAVYLRQQSGLDLRDSVLDESDGSLNSENAFRYLEMIRRGQAITDTHHTHIITHRQELLALIPQQIRFAKGVGVEIVR